MSEASTTTSATAATNRYESRRPVRQRSAPSRRARAVSRARRDFPQVRKTASTTAWGLGASASVFRDGSVHEFFNSFVHVHVVCPKSSVSTEKPDANQKWGRKPLRERPRLADDLGIKRRTIRGRSCVSAPEPNVIKRRLLAMPMRARRRFFWFWFTGSSDVSENVSRGHLPVVDLVTCGIGSR